MAVHGNRFIEHALVTSQKPITEHRVAVVHAALKDLVDELYGADCYLAVVFKNAQKCEQLARRLPI